MNAKTVGLTIAGLRKKNGLTQLELSRRLNISDKTVSRWESGLGYPEITQLPVLAALFGVSVDYLLTGDRRGMVIAGNILTDLVKNVDCYPEVGMLADIESTVRAVGGAVPNTAIDLAKIDRSIPITAIGRIGDDEHGRYILSMLQKYRIDTGKIRISRTSPTSFSDVISLPSGERTFFHQRGANREFCPEDVDLTTLNCKHLHMGYVALLDQFDGPDEDYGTVMARFLHDVQERGITTSIDAVSDSSSAFPDKIIPVLQYCNYVIINELECCNIWGIPPYCPDGSLNEDGLRRAMLQTLRSGVKDRVIVHCKEAGFCLDGEERFLKVPSLQIPKEKIRGCVGAGDAFCAGCLYGFYKGWPDRKILEFASAAAACNLFSENSVDGMEQESRIWEIAEQFGRI